MSEPVDKPSDTRERIMAGALKAMSRHGLRKVSIEDICVASEVSRRTLYRHFDGREEILAGISQHMREQFEADLMKAIAARPALEDRVFVVMDHLTSYPLSHKEVLQLVTAELRFVRDSVLESFDEYVALIRREVAPVFAAQGRLEQSGLNAHDLAELIMRLGMQALLAPAIPQAGAATTFAAYWKLVVQGATLEGQDQRARH